MKQVAFFGLVIFLSFCITDSSLSQLSTPPLSPEEAEVVKPFKKIVEASQKKDVELWMSAYHDKATIEITSGGKMSKDKLRKYFKFGKHASMYEVEKIEIKGDKATAECVCKEGDRVIPMKFDLVKEGGSWLIMKRSLR